MPCPSEIQVAFILSSFVTFFLGLLILLIFRLIWRTIKKWQNIKGTGILLELLLTKSIGNRHLESLRFQGIFRDHIEMLLSAQTFVGQVLVILVFVLSIGSLVIYFINSSDPVGSCSSYEDKTIPIDLTFNVFFSFYFGLRFVAADDKIKFWLEMNSIVDIFTVPPTFICYYLKSNWLGLRFLRALRLLELPQILQILRAIRTSNAVKFSKLLSIVLSTWFTAAGFIHLVENSGDPWLKGRNSQNISYFESVYLVMATTSTVGFGDVVAKTSLGRTFIMFFTLGSLVLFANYVPEMVELFANKRKYTSAYEVVKGKKFIVVCGNITVDSVTAFLRNFLRHKAGEINTEIVFLGEVPPSLELETIFKCNMAYTTFVSGSALKWDDLRRVAVESAEACLIIANPLCSDLQAEDTSNIMRVLSIKNYCPNTRIIIQILQSQNKVFLPKIPSWSWSTGDNIICFAELKLGFIAQGCLVPGMCTFLTSLFVEQNKKVFPKQPWQKYFFNGLKNKILTQLKRNAFLGKITVFFFSVSSCLMLNPPVQVKLRKNTLGFFIAESAKEVIRAFFYCASCHNDIFTPELIGKCSCKAKVHRHFPVFTYIKFLLPTSISQHRSKSLWPEIHICFSNVSNSPFSLFRTFLYEVEKDSDNLDSSGMFHWCRATSLDSVILKRMDKSKHEFRDHVVACVFGDATSTLIGLRNFVMPLRASSYTRMELKDIVFIGSLDYLKREWIFLRNFPRIFILPGSALFPQDLHAANIEECSMCAVLSSSCKASSNPALVDTETIMATLNIGSLRISCSDQSDSGYRFSGTSKYRRIPILTELKNPSNIHYIEQLSGLDESFSGTSLHLSTSFSTGTVFSGSFLDSLLATAFYNYHVLELLQMLVTGGISSQMEQQVDRSVCGLTNHGTSLTSERMRCKLGILSLNETILSDIKPRQTFGQLFCGSIDNFGILCLGLYRMIDEEENKFVITRPCNTFKLLPSDLVFCAIPFSTSCYKLDTTSPSPYETINIVPTSEKTTNTNQSSTINPVSQTTTQPLTTSVHYLEPKTSSISDSKQTVLTQSSKLPSQTYLGETETMRENGKEKMKERTEENAPASSKPN
uniref:Potassium channel subfamily U member 1 n=1 Tax=Neovison vison TaxID=452646 RepID=A0A8C7EQ09_NEOVI